MNTDKELLASEKQAITSTPLVSPDSILMTGLLGMDRTSPLRAFAQIETALSGGAGTGITVEVIQADNAALTTNVESLYSSGNIVTATANANRRLVDIPVPRATKAYLGFRYTSAGGAYGAGAITAGLVVGVDTPLADRPAYESHGF
jgi:hypothetical protein